MVRNRRDRTLAPASQITMRARLTLAAWGVIGGVLGGVLTSLATNQLLLNWQALKESSLEVDMLERRQGAGSLRWNLHLRPERRSVFNRPPWSGALLHAETTPDSQGNIPSMDWRAFSALEFFAKASSTQLSLKEINIFIGANHVQYVFDQSDDLRLSTEWREIEIPFDRFRLAPWMPGADRTFIPRSGQVTAFGFDVKNRTDDLQGSVWIDWVRLRRQDGSVVLLSNGDTKDFDFEGQALRWFASARDY